MPRSVPVSAKGVATRERILDAAVARFADQGFRETSVAAVARDAGVTAPAVHSYFASKQDLFHAAFERDVGPVLDVLGSEAEAYSEQAPGTPRPGGGMAGRIVAELGRHPLALRIFSGGEPALTRQLMTLPTVVEAHERLTSRVRAAQQAGVLRQDLPPGALAGGLETLIFALLLGALQMGMSRDAERRKAIAAIITQGIQAR
jgi:AcrR family transcriptional regulator